MRGATLIKYDREMTTFHRTRALHEDSAASHVYGTGRSDLRVMLRGRRRASLDVR